MAIKFKKSTSPAQRRAIRKMIAARKGSKMKGSTMATTRKKATPAKTRTRTVTKIVNRRLKGSYQNNFKDLSTVTGGALLATWLINIIPRVNQFNPLMKGVVMVAVGILLGQRAKKKMAKQIWAGTSIAGALTGTLPFLQKFAPDAKLAGGRPLTDSEVQALLGAPINLVNTNNGMSAPIDLGNNSMNAPIDVVGDQMGYSDYYTY